ncbi:MAG: pyridoxal-phosphate dependent enzyme, partial [Dehalococcoidia bacterium]
MHRWGEVLPLTERTPLLSLGEGDTPLIRSVHLESLCGVDELWFKLELCNPTGSFKDRGMVVAVAKAMEAGMRAI